ncbi:MAG: carboxylesterase family protein, partial [Oscillospiraceae bacterium]|nr:carboxylesterase family protein [Oscillospiraceae bacterium]
VVVTVNYRLNAFGFFCHPEITAESPEFPGNFGYLDQRFATMWVKRNAEAFGGDPNNNTIGGQSAGGGSVCSQLSCPDNEGLFQKAVIMSGMFAGIYDERRRLNFEEAQAQGEKFFEFLGVNTLEEARAIDAVTLRDKGVEFEEQFRARFGSVPDGKFLLADPLKRITAGNRLHVPVMIGRTQDEFRSRIEADTMEEFRDKVTASLGEYAEPFLKACGDDLETAKAMANVSGIEVAVRTFAKKNEEAGITEPIYYYVFNAEIPGWDNPGTFHSVDLWFFFENLAKCWRPFKGKHMDLARNMCNYWANFFRTGDPNGPDSDGTPMPLWKPYTDAQPNAIWFNDVPEPCVDKASEAVQILVERNGK